MKNGRLGEQGNALRNAMEDFLNGRDYYHSVSSQFDWSNIKSGVLLDIGHLPTSVQDMVRAIMDAKINNNISHNALT